MADDRHYVPGDNYLLDDLSGFKIRVSRSRRIPGGQTGGAQVDISRWEPQQSQDFVRGVPDNQNAAILRPRQANQFTVVGTWVTAPSARLTDEITVDSVSGFVAGEVSLSGLTMTLLSVLPESVGGSYGDPIENMVLQLVEGPPGDFQLDTRGYDLLNWNVLA